MTTETAQAQENIAEVVQKEVERTIQRSVRGIDVLGRYQAVLQKTLDGMDAATKADDEAPLERTAAE